MVGQSINTSDPVSALFSQLDASRLLMSTRSNLSPPGSMPSRDSDPSMTKDPSKDYRLKHGTEDTLTLEIN